MDEWSVDIKGALQLPMYRTIEGSSPAQVFRKRVVLRVPVEGTQLSGVPANATAALPLQGRQDPRRV